MGFKMKPIGSLVGSRTETVKTEKSNLIANNPVVERAGAKNMETILAGQDPFQDPIQNPSLGPKLHVAGHKKDGSWHEGVLKENRIPEKETVKSKKDGPKLKISIKRDKPKKTKEERAVRLEEKAKKSGKSAEAKEHLTNRATRLRGRAERKEIRNDKTTTKGEKKDARKVSRDKQRTKQGYKTSTSKKSATPKQKPKETTGDVNERAYVGGL